MKGIDAAGIKVNVIRIRSRWGGLERPNRVVFSNDGKTMYVVDYGEVYTNFQMPTPFYTVAKSGVIWTITYTGGN
jgi:sugar lactone lactonase YvrE